MLTVIVINGKGGVGKDSFVKECYKYYNYIYNISTIDDVKNAALLLGWDGVKDLKGRKFLSDLKDLACSNYDYSIKYIYSKVKHLPQDSIVFVHAREAEDIDRIIEEFDALTLLITNDRIEGVFGNHADDNVEKYDYNYIIENNGTINDLSKKAKEFLKEILDV